MNKILTFKNLCLKKKIDNNEKQNLYKHTFKIIHFFELSIIKIFIQFIYIYDNGVIILDSLIALGLLSSSILLGDLVKRKSFE